MKNIYYFRDAQGNVMGVYSKENNSPIYWNQQHLYGSSLVCLPVRSFSAGGWAANEELTNEVPDPYDETVIGRRRYELTNHLGNACPPKLQRRWVLTVVTDMKFFNGEYWEAEVINVRDYYPFGMLMPERSYTVDASYRYGFNGKENDNDVKGIEGSQQDYGFRIYDPRLGRFLSVDPLTREYPWFTPYQFSGNKPIAFVDLDGKEDKWYMVEYFLSADGSCIERVDIQDLSYEKINGERVPRPVGPKGPGVQFHIYLWVKEENGNSWRQHEAGETFISPKKPNFNKFSTLLEKWSTDIKQFGFILTGNQTFEGRAVDLGGTAKNVESLDISGVFNMLKWANSDLSDAFSSLKGKGAWKAYSLLKGIKSLVEVLEEGASHLNLEKPQHPANSSIIISSDYAPFPKPDTHRDTIINTDADGNVIDTTIYPSLQDIKTGKGKMHEPEVKPTKKRNNQ